MAARLPRLLVVLAVLLGVVPPLPAAGAVVRPPTSQQIAASPVPARGADPAYARSYFGARYYRSDLGRFTTVDPVLDQQAALTDPQRWNRYAYALNNPLKYTDPDGKIPIPVIIGGAAAARWLASPQGQRVMNAAVTRAQTLWIAATEFFNSPAGQETIQTLGEWASGAQLPTSAAGMAARGVDAAGQIHHIATDKNIRGGFTAAFEAVFAKGGMNLQDPLNKMFLVGDRGAHSPAYHQHVLDTLLQATEGLSGKSYSAALEKVLGKLRKELQENPEIVRGKGL